MSTDPPVRVVLWDADGVLQRVPGGGEESMRPAVQDRLHDVDAFLAEALREERPALTGEARWVEVLAQLPERWGIGDSYEDVLSVWLTIEPVPGTRDLVQELRADGVRCYLATNQDETRGRFMHDRLGYGDLLDGAFYSYELGLAKPDPVYFGTVVHRLRLAPEEALLVDDNALNVKSARHVGLRAEVWSYQEGLDVLRTRLAGHGLPVG
jgi:putative hydrolase of the HAD superfamily